MLPVSDVPPLPAELIRGCELVLFWFSSRCVLVEEGCFAGPGKEVGKKTALESNEEGSLDIVG